jgi:hypothetical protein
MQSPLIEEEKREKKKKTTSDLSHEMALCGTRFDFRTYYCFRGEAQGKKLVSSDSYHYYLYYLDYSSS